MAQPSPKLSIEKAVAFGLTCVSTGGGGGGKESEIFSLQNPLLPLSHCTLILHLPSRLMSGAEVAPHGFHLSVHLGVAAAFLVTTGIKLPLALTPVLPQAYQ